MKFWLVTVAAFTALFASTFAALSDSPTATAIWLLGVLVETVLFPWWGYLLAKRTR